MIASVSLLNQFTNNEFSDNVDMAFKFDFKFKSPFQLWIKGMHEYSNDLNIGTLGIAYLIDTKKWNVSLYAEKSFHENNLNSELLLLSKQNFYFNSGFIYYFKNDFPFFLKYSNIYKKTNVDNSYNKEDKLMLGSYMQMNKLLICYSLDFNVRDLLHLDIDNTEIGISVGYKIF
jgi:hypothetical protein